ncbi:MAG TPA: MobF family relaxase [Pirellulales bacterium]|jgi:conjugative relaxase-like TrwC/TraI family protein
MLRIMQSRSLNHARSYFSTADYYSEGRETIGRWRGDGARLLGLEGTIEQPDWEALCDNRHPASGETLTVRRKDDRTIGYDFNFHVPKSVSLLFARTHDERIVEAFRDSMDETMQDVEQDMATRVRKGGRDDNRPTHNMVWGEYIHLTSRPVDGVPDPLLHGHCYVFNTTFDSQENRWKAGQFREIKRDAPYFEALFHSRFAHRLHELGLPIERTKTGWELAGIDRDLVDKFSRRTQQIEDLAREKGIIDPELKAELGGRTREHKQKDLKFEELQRVWNERMTGSERAALDKLAGKLGGDAEPADPTAPLRAVDYATEHVFTRKSVVPERHLLATALKRSVGQATVAEVKEEAAGRDFITGDRKGRRMVTTPHVLAEEQRIIDFARDGRGTCAPFVRDFQDFQNTELSAEQQAAVKHILASRDRLVALRGAAGVGKTRLMSETARAIEENGTQVFAFAPSTDASRIVLRNDGFTNAETVATLLVNEKLQEQCAGQLIWIDEAGLMDSRTTAEVLALADRLDARVLLSGDRYQHGSVARGDVLRMLETEAGIIPAEVNRIQRQERLEYREAIQALSEHRMLEGYERLDRLGWIEELPYSERYQKIAADYLEAVQDDKTALVVCPTHLEGARVTRRIREGSRESGKLSSEERTFVRLENAHLTEAERGDRINYAPGDVLVFHQNAKGFRRGERLVVEADAVLPLDQAARFQVFRTTQLNLAEGDIVRITHNGRTADERHRLENGAVYRVHHFDEAGNVVLDNGWLVGSEYGHLAHGYVSTSHASQGKTFERVFVAQGRVSFAASSSEQFYVSTSRGTEQVRIYTEDKEELLDAVRRSDERLTATEFVHDIPQRQIERWRENERPERESVRQREREPYVYER